MTKGFYCSSLILHTNLLRRTLTVSLQFFESNPIGRIVARFSSDLNSIDKILPEVLGDFFYCLLEVCFGEFSWLFVLHLW